MAQDRNNPFSRENERHTNSPEQQGQGVNPSGTTQGTEGAHNVGGNDRTSFSPGREGGGNVREGQKSFRCADLGFADCRWETSGRTADEMMNNIERHGREQHNLSEADIERSRGKIRNAIKDRAA